MNEYLNAKPFVPSRIQTLAKRQLSESQKEALACLLTIALVAAMGVMLAWRG